ncbi:MAG TPA: HAD family phosphatase [Thermoanaerobaculia bacterium]|jgi:HAD superfamily hydrolase (TIGR01509 family)|nr:HAD family phosphatase [Thermoanaerobaculia bacterium]
MPAGALPLRAIFFDIGNVVLYFSHERMWRQLATACGTTTAAVRQGILDSGYTVLMDRGDVTTDDFVARLEEISGRTLDVSAVRAAAAGIFALNPGVAKMVEALAERDLELGVLSNTCEVHTSDAIEGFDVFRHFRHRIYSYRVGAVKPDAAIFRAAHDAAGCAPEQCFFTDDRPEFVAAARRAGFEAETFRGARYLRAQLARRGLVV